jgi:molybdopterin-guanine dinucleotide biosynthesis protein A
MPPSAPRHAITGGILAGGRGRRLGGADKGLIELDGRPLAAHIAARLAPQVDRVLVNANRNLEAYRALGHPVVQDEDPDFQGPLAGMAALLAHASTPWLVVVPCDGPFLPADLVERLWTARARARAEIGVAHDGTRLQPVYGLLPRALLADLRAYLQAGGRKIDRWYARHAVAEADFSDEAGDFFNVNTPEDRLRAEARLRAARRG